ncbi:MAG TPA: hypothetical protein VMK12_14130 [Anaeromyxobacteraceae bacterium]|nr:hypothetical protein [Anaeromyxobacteraceae bacterium]
MHCLYEEYLAVYREGRRAVEQGDSELLGNLRGSISRHPERKAMLLAYDDAVHGLPPRGRVHFCRMHLGAACTNCLA